MPHDYTPTPLYTSPIVQPSDGDEADVASVNVPLEALANNAEALRVGHEVRTLREATPFELVGASPVVGELALVPGLGILRAKETTLDTGPSWASLPSAAPGIRWEHTSRTLLHAVDGVPVLEGGKLRIGVAVHDLAPISSLEIASGGLLEVEGTAEVSGTARIVGSGRLDVYAGARVHSGGFLACEQGSEVYLSGDTTRRGPLVLDGERAVTRWRRVVGPSLDTTIGGEVDEVSIGAVPIKPAIPGVEGARRHRYFLATPTAELAGARVRFALTHEATMGAGVDVYRVPPREGSFGIPAHPGEWVTLAYADGCFGWVEYVCTGAAWVASGWYQWPDPVPTEAKIP